MCCDFYGFDAVEELSGGDSLEASGAALDANERVHTIIGPVADVAKSANVFQIAVEVAATERHLALCDDLASSRRYDGLGVTGIKIGDSLQPVNVMTMGWRRPLKA